MLGPLRKGAARGLCGCTHGATKIVDRLRRWSAGGDHAMINNITSARAGEAEGLLFDSWFDPIEDGLRAKVRGFIETMIEEELTTALSRPRYGRRRNGEEAEVGVPERRLTATRCAPGCS